MVTQHTINAVVYPMCSHVAMVQKLGFHNINNVFDLISSNHAVYSGRNDWLGTVGTKM